MANSDVDNALTALSNLTINTAPRNIDCLPFNPLARTTRPVDRYLFRIFDHKTGGETNDEIVSSLAASLGKPTSTRDIFSRQDKDGVAAMISRHLRWKDCPQQMDDLVSWTSLVLFALQYAIYRHRKHGTPFSAVKLCVVDTKDLPTNVFVSDLDLMEEFSQYNVELANMQDLRGRKHGIWAGSFYFGEYLSQGTLQIEGHRSIVSVQDLIDRGFFSLQPGFRSYEGRKPEWAYKVVSLRQAHHDKQQLVALDGAKVDTAMEIGELFGARWKLPMAAAFLSLRTYIPGVNVSCQLWSGFMRYSITDGQAADFAPARTKVVAAKLLPEVQQFARTQELIWAIWICFPMPVGKRRAVLLKELMIANAEAEVEESEV